MRVVGGKGIAGLDYLKLWYSLGTRLNLNFDRTMLIYMLPKF